MTDSRAIELSVEVPGTPEEVWAAIATGPGITSWFIPMDIEERVGGAVRMDFGSMGSESGRVVAWEPPHRVVFEGSENSGQRLAYEWLVEARDGGSCVVRLVNSGFAPDADWDGDYEGMTSGWKIFMENLRLQLTHFRGQRAHASIPVVMVPGPNRAAWSTFCAAIGVSPTIAAGDRFTLEGEGVPELRARVEAVTELRAVTAALLVLDGATPGTGFIAAEGDGDQVACSLYLYLYGDSAVDAADAWAGFVTTAAASPAPTT